MAWSQAKGRVEREQRRVERQIVVDRFGAERLREAEKMLCGYCVSGADGGCRHGMAPLTTNGEECPYMSRLPEGVDSGYIPRF